MTFLIRCAFIAVAAAFVPSVSVTALADQKTRPHVVMLIAEREYSTDESLVAFADSHLQEYRCTFVFASPDDGNRLEGIEAVANADVLVVSVRRRTLPPQQLTTIRDFVAAGKPVIGIRTASHAFSLRNREAPQGRAVWPEFDKQVFGGNYTNHHGNDLKTTVRVPDKVDKTGAELLKGLESVKPFASGGSLYRVSPLANGTVVLLIGSVEGHPDEPVAWTMIRKDGGKSFYTSLGHPEDFRGDVLPRLLVNAIQWGLK